MRLQGKVALITGGNSGIGLATARRFVEEGAKVAITGRNEATLAEAVQSIGGDVLAIRADAGDPAAIERAAAETVAKFGRLDIVFANAGIGGSTPVGSTSLEQFETIIRTNLTGVFFTVQATAPHLGEGGSIILNGSVHAVLGAPGMAAYAATKAGVRSMARVLGAELAPRGIRVNLVVPGATRTPIWNSRAPTPDAFAELEAGISRAVPNGRISEAEDIANAVLFLASDEARNIQGAEIVVDGGHTAAPAGAPIYRG